MNNKIKIKVFNSSLKFINYLVYNNICYTNLEKHEEYYLLNIDYDDLKLFKKFKVEIVEYYGFNKIKFYIKYNRFILIGILFGLFILFLLQNTIFDVCVKTSNEELNDKIILSLKKNGIEKYKSKKSFDEIQNIKKQILEENSDTLEWIEIEEDGCNYIVEVTPRVIGNNFIKDDTPKNVVAKKDGLILFINLENGVQVKDKNDYVKKGDIIISGTIMKGDKFIDNISAEGKVYAEVWYTSKISMPFKYTEYVETGKVINHYYLDIFGKKMTILGKYDSENVFSQSELLIDKPYLFFDLYKETKREYKYQTINLNKEEAFEEALKRSDAIINRTLKEEEYIMYKKILKKEVFSSKIKLEVFYKVYEDITDTSKIEEVIND